MLQKFQHVQTIIKRAHNLIWLWVFDKPGELLLSQEFIFYDDNFMGYSTWGNSDVVVCARERSFGT